MSKYYTPHRDITLFKQTDIRYATHMLNPLFGLIELYPKEHEFDKPHYGKKWVSVTEFDTVEIPEIYYDLAPLYKFKNINKDADLIALLNVAIDKVKENK